MDIDFILISPVSCEVFNTYSRITFEYKKPGSYDQQSIFLVQKKTLEWILKIVSLILYFGT